jgi:protein TonB
MLALPGRLLDAVFPAKPEAVPGVQADLTPDFEEIAFSVLRLPREPVIVPPEISISEVADLSVVPEPPQAPGGYGPSGAPGIAGSYGPPTDTRFFPPVPRLIVPPDLADLHVSALKIDIRILVGTDGHPLEIDLPDTLLDRETRRRLMESVASFRFEPARRGNQTVPAWINLPLELEARE